MNFGQAKDSIIDTVHRADKATDIGDAINEAISVLATKPWALDLTSATVTVTSPTDYEHSFDSATSPFTRFKRIKWMKPPGWTKYIQHRDPARIFVENCESLNTWYMEGTTVIFKVSSLITTVRVGYYQYHATLSAAADTDWMLVQLWPVVRAYVLAEIYRQIGDDAESQSYKAKWPLLWDLAHVDFGDANEVT